MLKVGDKCEVVGACCHRAGSLFIGEAVVIEAFEHYAGFLCTFCGFNSREPRCWVESISSDPFFKKELRFCLVKWLRKLPDDGEEVSEEVWNSIGWHPPKEKIEV